MNETVEERSRRALVAAGVAAEEIGRLRFLEHRGYAVFTRGPDASGASAPLGPKAHLVSPSGTVSPVSALETIDQAIDRLGRG